ncbi:MAG: PAS domain-containing protein [Fidelibacterota bacterium]
MPSTSVEILWVLTIGTGLLLVLAAAVITAILISHRRQAQAEHEKLQALERSQLILIESEEKYRTLVESMEDAVLVVDKTETLVFVNNQFASLVGESVDDCIGKRLSEVIRGMSGSELKQDISKVFITGKTIKDDYLVETVKGNLWMETTMVPQYGSEGKLISVLVIPRDVTKRRQLEEQLKDLIATLRSQQETLRALSSEVIRAQEAERKRISREIHDSMGQALTAISLDLEIVRQQSPFPESETRKRITNCISLIHETMEDIHRFSHELHPAVLDKLGLLPAVRSHIRGFTDITGIEVEVNGVPEIEKVDNEIKTVLYRVIQEGLNNVAKHSQAQSVVVDIGRQRDAIYLSIEDNGRGFNLESLAKGRSGKIGIGLQGMKERVKLVGGDLNVESKPGKGTKLLANIPYGEA